jgi:hypothetical protein
MRLVSVNKFERIELMAAAEKKEKERLVRIKNMLSTCATTIVLFMGWLYTLRNLTRLVF